MIDARTAEATATLADDKERLLWAVMRAFEVQALAQYETVSDLATASKRQVVSEICGFAPSYDTVEASELATVMSELLESAGRASGPPAVLVAQGLVLERMREVVYGVFATSARSSRFTRARAALAARESAAMGRQAARLFGLWTRATGEDAFNAFVAASDDVLLRLDAVGEGVDRVFGEEFELSFSGMVGDFVADLVPVCVDLGMDRRKVLSHLAGALMGI